MDWTFFLVAFHLATEYAHYIWEWYSGRKDGKILEDIHNHRKKSQKTLMLEQIQADLELIKERLDINDESYKSRL